MYLELRAKISKIAFGFYCCQFKEISFNKAHTKHLKCIYLVVTKLWLVCIEANKSIWQSLQPHLVNLRFLTLCTLQNLLTSELHSNYTLSGQWRCNKQLPQSLRNAN